MGKERSPSRRTATALAALVTALCAAVPASARPHVPVAAGPEPPPPPPAEQTEQDWATTTLRQMSLPEKVGQLFVTYVHGTDANAPHPENRKEYGVDTPAEVVERYHLGGVVYFNWSANFSNPPQVARLSNGLQRAALASGARIPLLISTDQEHGMISRLGPPATQFPGGMALGAGRDTGAAEEAARIAAAELRAVGINQNYAPVADVNVNPANPIIGIRSFSSDPTLAADMVAAQVRGYQKGGWRGEGVASTVKHFPGHGDTNVDSHTGLPVIEHDREQWQQLDAPPFRAAIEQGVDMIMSAHIVVPKLDSSGEPATLSPTVLTGMLRKELGFHGVVITDSLQMEGVRQRHSDAEIAVRALLAGADQLLMPQDMDAAYNGVLEAVRSGRISEQRIDESVRRVLEMKFRQGILIRPIVDESAVSRTVGTPENLAAAQRITDGTTTLIRNDDKILPLRSRPNRVLVTGWGETTTATLAKRISARGPSVTTKTTGMKPDASRIAEAVGAAKEHDLTVVLTNGAWNDPGQRDLVRQLAGTGKPVVTVAVRDAYDAAHVDEAHTWLATYSYAPVAMESLAKVVFGEIAPRGKLPVAIPDPGRPGVDRYPFGHGLGW
ncbi:beta-N-acetylhexosaminidase [Longimycelium tulufanense]|uniref:beta-N-acetylhexosaminidase n=1 Tax=Longimycelium tulufanense TaxID=907463 RepID=A0A8J3CAK6_9PSEU|nr:glycoside hydrolase family 3 protein [Longimycelium tulufanense]GGM65418.1 beta-N-acetylhexosaminidase [Longimycelium tulufanense]